MLNKNLRIKDFVCYVILCILIGVSVSFILYSTFSKSPFDMHEKEKNNKCEELILEKESGNRIYIKITNQVREENGGALIGFFAGCEKHDGMIYCFKNKQEKDCVENFSCPKEFISINKTMLGTIESIDDLIIKNGC